MSDTNVIAVDFGKPYNEAARSLATLMQLAEDQERALAADPAAFLREATDRIVALQRQMRAAARALFPTPTIAVSPSAGSFIPMQTVSVPRADYDRWKACERIIEEWRR